MHLDILSELALSWFVLAVIPRWFCCCSGWVGGVWVWGFTSRIIRWYFFLALPSTRSELPILVVCVSICFGDDARSVGVCSPHRNKICLGSPSMSAYAINTKMLEHCMHGRPCLATNPAQIGWYVKLTRARGPRDPVFFFFNCFFGFLDVPFLFSIGRHSRTIRLHPI